MIPRWQNAFLADLPPAVDALEAFDDHERPQIRTLTASGGAARSPSTSRQRTSSSRPCANTDITGSDATARDRTGPDIRTTTGRWLKTS